MHHTIVAGLLSLTLIRLGTLAFPVTFLSSNPKVHLPLPWRTVFQFSENGTWLENIAVRSSGALLTTMMLPSASLYQVDEPRTRVPPDCAELLYSFPNISSLFGIAETEPDVFVIAGGNLTTETVAGVPGTFAVWEVDFNRPPTSSPLATNDSASGRVDDTFFTVHKFTDIPEACFLNGVVALPTSDETTAATTHSKRASGQATAQGPIVLLADSTRGLIWRLDTRSAAYSVVLQTPEMAPVSGATPTIGVNGLKYVDGYLYFTNSFETTMYRVNVTPDESPVTSDDGSAGVVVETVAVVPDEPFIDDFVLGPPTSTNDTTVWVTTNAGNNVVRIDLQTGESVVVEGSATTLTVAGDTAAAFGRTAQDRDTLYVVTGGTSVNPVNESREPGKIVAIDTHGFD
jgi:hypothetical protein